LTAPTDEQLMQRIQQGEQKAFQILVERYVTPLQRYASRFLSNANEAEDVVQESLLKVWRNAERWQADKAKVSTWIYSITHNLCIDLYRRKRLDTVSLDEALETPEAPELSDLNALEISQHLSIALQALPERQRSALLLCYYQGMSAQEAASVMSVSNSAVESLLARARRALRSNLSNDSFQ